jgi:predicted PurR-regulated permease PerM
MESQPSTPINDHIVDRFVRLALLAGLLAWCGLILAPFTSLLLWAVLLAVALHPFHRRLSGWLAGRSALAAGMLVATGLLLIVLPGYAMSESILDTATTLRQHLSVNGMQVPSLPAEWYQGVGLRRMIANSWPSGTGALAAMIRDHTDALSSFAHTVLNASAAFGLTMLIFLGALVCAGFLLVHADRGGAMAQLLLVRVNGAEAERILALATSTVRNVAKGILGVAIIQSFLLAAGLFVAGIPGAGPLALVGLLLAVVQVGIAPIVIGVLIHAYATMDTLPAILLTIWLVITLLMDNFLKPVLLGRGAMVPSIVIFLGSIGGFLLSGIIGLFTGAVVLSVGYVLLLGWVGAVPGNAEKTA